MPLNQALTKYQTSIMRNAPNLQITYNYGDKGAAVFH